jgi:uronate dehydrogenase
VRTSEGGAAGGVSGRVSITGAAGTIGACLREGLRPIVDGLVLVDVREIEPTGNERFIHCDLRDLEAVRRAVQGVAAVVHLGAVPNETSFDELLQPNVVGTFNLFEAARLEGVSRVVFASSIHASGFYPIEQTLTGREPPRPDSLYGVTKVFGETLGQLYTDKFGLDVLCVRIGAFLERPHELRDLPIWLSPRDAVRLFASCISAPAVGFRIVYGTSANTRLCCDLAPARELGYDPQDDSERYASEVGSEFHELHGGSFTHRHADGWV